MSSITIHVYDGDPEEYDDEDETSTVGARVPNHRHSYGDGEELDAVKTIGWLLAENKHFDVRFFNN